MRLRLAETEVQLSAALMEASAQVSAPPLLPATCTHPPPPPVHEGLRLTETTSLSLSAALMEASPKNVDAFRRLIHPTPLASAIHSPPLSADVIPHPRPICSVTSPSAAPSRLRTNLTTEARQGCRCVEGWRWGEVWMQVWEGLIPVHIWKLDSESARAELISS